MTHVINAKNVNHALSSGLWWLHASGYVDESRVGRVLVSPDPVITEYQKPAERVLFSPLRDANPFFHLMESLWMMAGRDDVRFVQHYASGMAAFSDDGVRMHGAYGHRWRYNFGVDQIALIIDELRANKKTRRCVLAMWDASEANANDLLTAMTGGKDVPCNTHAYFDTLNDVLNMTICNRSNDVVWGCYGANAVHFSFLHEVIANGAALPIGVYRQFSNNYHIYLDRPDVKRLHDVNGAPLPVVEDYYSTYGVVPFPIINTTYDMWMQDLRYFFDVWETGGAMNRKAFADPFWHGVVVPVFNAFEAYKKGDHSFALAQLDPCLAQDWKLACQEWIKRRQEKRHV